MNNGIINDDRKTIDNKTKDKLLNYKKIEIADAIPNPIIIKSENDYKIISEKILQQIILENLEL